VVRGGGWYGVANLTTSARRSDYAPATRGRVIGFRAIAR
jgi:formylglycine-generating enzyme required for sulfatase activity